MQKSSNGGCTPLDSGTIKSMQWFLRDPNGADRRHLLKKLPPNLIHVFGCDYAKYTLDTDRYSGYGRPSWRATCLDTINTKRLWIEGRASDEDLSVAAEKANRVWTDHVWWAAYLTRNIAATNVADICNDVLSGAYVGDVSRWQTRRLVYLVSLWLVYGDATPRIIRLKENVSIIQEGIHTAVLLEL